MSEAIRVVLRIFVLIAFWALTIFGLVAVLNLAINATLNINSAIVREIQGVVQVWLPFNLGPVLAWLITAATAYLTYRGTLIAYRFVRDLISG